MFENENFSAPNILTGTAQVESTTLTQVHVLTPTLTVGSPQVDTATMSQAYVFELNNIITGLPDIGSANFPYGAPLTPTISLFTEIIVPDPDVNEIWGPAPDLPPPSIWTEQQPKV